ncbi:MAG: hypothetical protein H0U70_02400 [Tatlockia sp.]|nr:hypothetical protein [Tatlockia sp.]
MRIKFLSFLFIILSSGCAHYADLRGQTLGSVTGAIAGGVLAGAESSGDLILIGAGTIIGSIVGSAIGASFDDMSRNHQRDPLDWPISLDCYDTYRPWPYNIFKPVTLLSVCPGMVVPPERPNLYGCRAWHDLPLL